MDSSSNALSILKCAVSSNDDAHFCEEPLILTCGHYICKVCVQAVHNHSSIKCSICNEINNQDLSSEIKPQAFDFILNEHLSQVFKVTYEKLNNTLKIFDYIANNNDERIDKHVQLVQDEVKNHIANIKTKLDSLYESFNKELHEIKTNWKLEHKKIEINETEKKKYHNELQNLKNNIKYKQSINKENLYHFQQQIKSIKNTIDEYNERTPKLNFLPNERNIEKELIGKLMFEVYDGFDDEMKNKVKTGDYKSFDVGCKVWDINGLPNEKVLFTSYKESSVLLYDKNMQLIKKVDEINNKNISIIGVADNGNNEIFLSDYDHHLIIKTDLQLNHLKSFGNGPGSSTNQLHNPTGICFNNQYLYVCDSQNKRIVQLDSNLNFQASFQVDYFPWYIKILNNVAMVRASCESSIYFYDLDDFTLIRKYEGHNGIIGVSKRCFYEFFPNNKIFYCYNKYGELIEEIQTDGLNLTKGSNWGTIGLFNSQLYFTHHGSNSITIV